jgi:hypothetical protein
VQSAFQVRRTACSVKFQTYLIEGNVIDQSLNNKSILKRAGPEEASINNYVSSAGGAGGDAEDRMPNERMKTCTQTFVGINRRVPGRGGGNAKWT